MYKWKWPEGTGKLRKPLNFQLNPEMGVRVLGKHETILHFKSNEDNFDLRVGPAAPETIEDAVTEIPTVGIAFYEATLFQIHS